MSRANRRSRGRLPRGTWKTMWPCSQPASPSRLRSLAKTVCGNFAHGLAAAGQRDAEVAGRRASAGSSCRRTSSRRSATKCVPRVGVASRSRPWLRRRHAADVADERDARARRALEACRRRGRWRRSTSCRRGCSRRRCRAIRTNDRGRSQHYVVSTPTTSRTASADASNAVCSSSERSSSTICSMPAAPSFTGTPM